MVKIVNFRIERISMGIQKDGLNIEQWKAAEIFALGNKIKNKEVAKEIGVKTSTIREWKRDPRFKLAILQRFEENMNTLRNRRVSTVANVIDVLEAKLTERLGTLESDAYSIKEYIGMITKLNNELRFDTNQFNKNKYLIRMLAEYTGHDPDALDENDLETMDAAEQRYLSRRIEARDETESKVVELSGKRKKKKKKKAASG